MLTAAAIVPERPTVPVRARVTGGDKGEDVEEGEEAKDKVEDKAED
jgi:hypothetical protein